MIEEGDHKQMSQPIKVAVITGGHAYDVVSFRALFRRMVGVDTYVQHMEDFASSAESVRDGYDAVLFYGMPRTVPTDEGLPGYAGKPLTALLHLGETKQGIVILHHALLAYPQWPVWNEVTGISDRTMSSYHPNQSLFIGVADAQHPICHGLAGWDLVDETYVMAGPGADSHVLLTTDHPQSTSVIGWTRQYKQSRVFCCALGHDNVTWQNINFTTVMRRGLLWSAGAL